jgi:hypothetical protein
MGCLQVFSGSRLGVAEQFSHHGLQRRKNSEGRKRSGPLPESVPTYERVRKSDTLCVAIFEQSWAEPNRGRVDEQLGLL